MGGIENLFDKCFVKYGGRFAVEGAIPPVEEELRPWLNDLRKTLNDFNSGHSWSKDAPDIHIDIINNSKLGAAAGTLDGRYFIGINYGTFYVLRDTIFRLMRCPTFLTNIGAAAEEDLSYKIYSAEQFDAETLFLSKNPEEELRPKCMIRTLHGTFLLKTAYRFILAHEYAHIINGHVDLNASNGFMLVDEELRLSESGNLLSPVLEMNADAKAVCLTLQAVIDLPMYGRKDAASFCFFNKHSIARIFHAMIIFFRLYGFNRYKLDLLYSYTHPPVGVRLTYSLATFKNYLRLSFDDDVSNTLVTLSAQCLDDVERGFREVSEKMLDVDMFAFAVNENAMVYMNDLLFQWKSVRQMLLPYTYCELAI